MLILSTLVVILGISPLSAAPQPTSNGQRATSQKVDAAQTPQPHVELTCRQEPPLKPWANPAWIGAASTVLYTLMTLWIIFEQRETRKDDKLPCVVIRSRLNPAREVHGGMTSDEWKLRLINIGGGPAFIEHFETTGVPGLENGAHTNAIDQVIGPDVGDPDQQIDFASGEPSVLREPGVRIVVRYRDVSKRLFETRLENGRVEFLRL